MGKATFCGILIVLGLMHSYTASPVQGNQKDKQSSPIRPKSYTLNLQPFPDEEQYTGDVKITIIWLETTNVISLNANKSLKIDDTKAVLINVDGEKEELKIVKVELPDVTNTLNIVLEKTLNAGAECEIHVKFTGKINTNSTERMFKRTLKDETTGKTSLIIAGNLKPLASSVFPCFDDPSLKAPFDVSIQRRTKFNALSSTLLLESYEVGRDWHKDVFDTSPPMAASSLAIFVSNLTPMFSREIEVHLRLWPAPEFTEAIKANRSGVIYSAIQKYQDIFGVKYPLRKLDYIALPTSSGLNLASWGLIISSNERVGTDPLHEKRTITSQLASQWLGDLVTPQFSDEESKENLLHEGLHNFVAYYFTRKGEDLDWPSNGLYATYYELGTPSPRDDKEIIRICSSAQATAIYRMLSYILTDHTFSIALKNFMKKQQLKTYIMDDFWDSLNEQAHGDGNLPRNMTVKEIAMSWLDRYRFPYVTVTRNYNENSALLTQRLFIRKRPVYLAKDDEALLWKIPIVLKTEDKLDFKVTKPNYWLTQRELIVKNVAAKSDQFVLVNPEEIAPFVVNYDKTNWKLLAEFLQSEDRVKIPVITRAKLVHDALNLAYSGSLDFGTALNMTLFLKNEKEHTVWKPYFIMFDHIGRHIGGTKAHKKYEKFVKLLAKPVYDHLKANNEKKNNNKETFDLYKEVKSVLMILGYEDLMKEANAAYKKWMDDPNANYAAASNYLCSIFEYGTTEQWEYGLNVLTHLEGKPEIERYYLFKCLVGCTHDSSKIKRFLNMTLFDQGTVFTDDDFNYATFMLTGDASGFMATFEYLRDNFGVLKTRLQNKPEIWKQLVYTATNLYKDQDGLNKVSEFYTKHRGEFGEAETTMQNSLKKIQEEVQWTNENMGELEDWLDNYILKNSPQN